MGKNKKQPAVKQLSGIDGWLEWLRTTKLPFTVELLLAWIVVVCFSIRYMLGYAVLVYRMRNLRHRPEDWHEQIPITSVSQTKAGLVGHRQTLIKRLILILQTETKMSKDATFQDDHVLKILRNNLEARQLSSQVMTIHKAFKLSSSIASRDDTSQYRVVLQLRRLWPQLIQMPPPPSKNDQYKYTISVIVPAYKESLKDILATLRLARSHCSNPAAVQLIVVHAGGLAILAKHIEADVTNDTTTSPAKRKVAQSWGDVKIVEDKSEGGRGRCMNIGASKATGRIVTFLHADTLLPPNWDVSIQKALRLFDGDQNLNSNHDHVRKDPLPTCCAFTQGIDLSKRGLKGGPCPPGINPACKLLGFIRVRLCAFPYGDSVLSFPAYQFQYLGGYPDQPLMEDFDLVSQLRKRSFLLNECIQLIPDRAYCSVRRWQAYGVVYTVLINALCVHRYNSGTTADELFDLYYQRPKKA